MANAEDDEQFATAHAAWRQFHGLRLELPAPLQPEIDGRLMRYRQGHEAGAIRDFAAGSLMLAGIGKALADLTVAFTARVGGAEALVYLLTCALILVLGVRSLAYLRNAVEHYGMAQRIGTDSIDWNRADSMLADTRDIDVRSYCQEVRGLGRPLRRAEAAVALERGRGTPPLADAEPAAFVAYLREGRTGPSRREFATAALCLLAVAATHAPAFNTMALFPALLLLGVWCFTDLLGPLVQLLYDPWQLRGGGTACRRLRLALLTDLAPPAAVVLVVIATAAAIAGAGS